MFLAEVEVNEAKLSGIKFFKMTTQIFKPMNTRLRVRFLFGK